MSIPKSNATRLSVRDFNGDNDTSSPDCGIVFMEGCDFPASFTYGSPGILDGVAFCVCLCGDVSVKVNSKLCHLTESSAFVIMPNHIVEPVQRSADLKLRLILVSLDYFTDVKLNVDNVKVLEDNPVVDVSAQDKEILADMFMLVNKLCIANNERRNSTLLTDMVETIVHEFSSIVTHHAATASDAKVSRAEELTQQFLKMVIARYKETRSVDHYADELCVSPKYLTQVVRQTTGETPFGWINKIVIIGAKNLIRTRDVSILQVSEELNFPNPSFFGRYFKKHAGMTPLEFRKNER